MHKICILASIKSIFLFYIFQIDNNSSFIICA